MEDALIDLDSSETCVLANPAFGDAGAEMVKEAARKAGLNSHFVFRTSGSRGPPKFVCLSRDALAASAEAVNEFLGTASKDAWLRALPRFHVGGFGVVLRAQLAGIPCVQWEGKWDADGFVESCRKAGVTLTALVPAQLHDLAAGNHECPPELRAVLAGGGWLPNNDREKLLERGWPIRMTYGMTEAGSQVATDPGDGVMRVLPIWETRTDEDGRLALRGKALFSGYLAEEEDGFRFVDPRDSDGWFLTRDLVGLDGDKLEFAGRVDRFVKILGELVDLDALEERACGIAGVEEGRLAIVAVPDQRRGFRLMAALAEKGGMEWMNEFNNGVAGCERIEEARVMDELPRTGAGKIDRSALQAILASDS